MEYAALVEVYDRLAGTQSTHRKVAIVAETLAETPREDLPMVLRLLRGELFAPWDPAELGVSSSLASRAIERATGVPEAEVETDWRETGDLGSAAARAVERAVQQTLVSETLTVERVYGDLRDLADYEGAGSEDRRVDAVAGLLADADPAEAKYVVRTALGHLRLGVGRGTVRDAIAAAFLHGDPDEPGETPEDDVAAVERALQVTNEPGLVAQTAAEGGRAGLADLDLEVGRPVEVMLAEKADSVETAVADALEASSAAEPGEGDGEEDDDGSGNADSPAPPAPLSEYKVDGFRAQVHFETQEAGGGSGDSGDGETGPQIFTRRLEDVTAQFPDVVDAMAGFDADAYIVEGEVVAYDPDTGEPVPFQQLSRRIKRKHDVQRLVEEVPVVIYLFDLLYLDGESLLDRSLVERVDALEGRLTELANETERMPNLRSRDPDRVREFYEDALAAGHEGIMVKTADATYQPGKRVGYTRKVKPTMESLDLVVTRAKWSEGRRSNNLGRLYLACRDGEDFREVGRLSTGFTDEQLADLTARLEPHILEEDGRDVDLEPTEVLEVAYEEIQQSPEYDSGYALRFPRFEGFRDDLDVGDADTLERVESLYESQ
ncbi:MAG: ATP-dependent DNA ligase [Haloarculaceae archaeon]